MSWQKQQNDPDLAVVVPNTGTVSFDWCTKFSSLRLPEHVVSSKQTAALDLAREQTIEMAMEVDPEWVLFLDSDVFPPKDIFFQLRQHDLDVISGVYYVKKDPPHPAMWRLDKEDTLSPVYQFKEDLIVEVDAVGLGCTLVNKRVFEDIDRPWFRWTEGYEDHPWDMRSVGGQQGIGEDFYFCHKAKEAGYNIYVDTSIMCLHEGSALIGANGYRHKEAYKTNNE